VREVASKTSDVAGDGTTTPRSWRRPSYSEGRKNVAAGANPQEIQTAGIEAARSDVASLKAQSNR